MPGFKINGEGEGPKNTSEYLFQQRWLIDTIGPIGKDRAFVAKEVALPDLRMERQEVLGGLVWYKFAKAVKFDDATITFYDDNAISNAIDKWRKLVYTEDGGVLQHTSYKKDTIIKLLDGQGSAAKTITLKNSWPANISQGRLTYTESDLKIVVVTLAFDWMEMKSEKSL